MKKKTELLQIKPITLHSTMHKHTKTEAFASVFLFSPCITTKLTANASCQLNGVVWLTGKFLLHLL